MSEEQLRTNPYVGLRPFFTEDSLYFYGREDQTEELLAILRDHRFLGVVGSSGSGKSSLVRAGLLPGLLGGFLVQDRDLWQVAQVKPGGAPIGNLCAGLLDALEVEATAADLASFEQSVRDGHTNAVTDFLRARLKSNANLFLLVDQFEEIFAFRGADEEEDSSHLDLPRRTERARRKAESIDFVDLLLSLAAQQDLPIYVAITMRTDFLGECDLFRGLPEALNRGRYLVPRMSRAQLRDAVECPALLLGAQVAPRLLDHIVNELGDRFDRLPVLQHALLRSWDEWDLAGGIGNIDLRHFNSAGGLAGSLAKDAEAALEGLDVGITARVFKRLTDTDISQRRIRSPARITELMVAANADRAVVQRILRHFEKDGRSFIHCSADGKPDDPRVDISHESLIRQWGRLRNWVDEERRSRDQYRELVIRAARYERGDVALLQNPELQIAIDWRATATPTSGWAGRYSTADGEFDNAMRYLDESQTARSRELADQELSGRWKKIWHRLLAVEAVIGLWLASGFGGRAMCRILTIFGSAEDSGQCNREEVRMGFLAESGRLVAEFIDEWYQVKLRLGSNDFIGNMAELFGLALFGLEQFVALLLNPHFFTLAGLLALFLYLNRSVTRAYRARNLPLILETVESLGGRSPVVAEELPDASEAKSITYASVAQRLRGWFLDAFRQGVIVCLIFFAGAFFAGMLEAALDIPTESTVSDSLLISVLVAIVVVNWWLSIGPLTSEQRATKGMLNAGIYRVDKYGQRMTYTRATAWYLTRLLSFFFLNVLAFAAQPFMSRRQTLYDWVTGTVVLRVPPKVAATVVRRVAPIRAEAASTGTDAKGE